MKISLEWLRVHLDFPGSAEDLSAALLKLGFEVAGIERRGPQFTGVVVAKVLAKDKHPNADKLALCVVDDGATKWSVVCGAPNVAAGQTIAFARIGAVLPGNFKIEGRKLRGVESQGMICSRAELGLPKDGDGIWVMGEGPALGSDVGALLGPADAVLEVEVTSNRPDCLSHRGLARELAAALGKSLKPISFEVAETSTSALTVRVEDAAACPSYSLRVIEGIKNGAAPEFVKRRLEAIGLRPINAAADATNMVLHGLGQPLHAFDADKLAGGTVIVRRSRAGEKLRALDHKTYDLPEGLLVIADAEKVVALAGVMGGEDTAVTEATTRVALESAHFAPSEVRKSSQKTRLRSDSSYRFERGTDPAGPAAASARATAVILEACGGKAAKPVVVAAAPVERPAIKSSAARLNALLGAEFSDSEVVEVLKKISASFDGDAKAFSFRAPSWRHDLATANDLSEEVGRFLGYDRVPYRLGRLAPRASTVTPVEAASRRARTRLAALGLSEAYNYDLLPEKALVACRLSADGLPRVANPLSEDWAVLRPSLIPGLLKSAQYNLSRGADAVRFFEVGKVYAQSGGAVEEGWRVAGLLLGPVLDARWQSARAPRAGFADAKAVAEELLGDGIAWSKVGEGKAPPSPGEPAFHPVNAARASIGGKTLATVGWLHPRVARAFDLEREGVVVFEADLESLAARSSAAAKFREFSALPASRRDLAIVVDKSVEYGRVEGAIRGAKIDALQDVLLFDVYEGKGVPEGKKSLAIRLTFGLSDRTLTDAEVAGFVEKVVAALGARTGAVLRG